MKTREWCSCERWVKRARLKLVTDFLYIKKKKKKKKLIEKKEDGSSAVSRFFFFFFF